MNKLSAATLLSWRTRNWRHQHKAEQWCKDYALIPLHKTLYIGTLHKKERNELNQKLANLFTGKQEYFCSFNICSSCIKDAKLGHALYALPIPAFPPYEII